MAGSHIAIRPIEVADAGEVLTIQQAAFVSEAIAYRDPDMDALVEPLDAMEFELRDNLGCVAMSGERVVGAARAVRSGDLLLIGRIAIAPDQQGEGIGSDLLAAVEDRGRHAGCREAELFTGSLSTPNLALYKSLGYRETERVPQSGGTEQIFLRKPLTGAVNPLHSRSGQRQSGTQEESHD